MPGSHLIAVVVRGTRCVVFGGDEQARARVVALLQDGASSVVVIWPSLEPETREFAANTPHVSVEEREVIPSDDIRLGFLAVLTPIHEELASALYVAARREGRLFCAVDQPEHCTFTQVAVVRRGPLRVGVSTCGEAPLLARKMREGIEAGLDARFAAFVGKVSDARNAAPRGQRYAATAPLLEGFKLSIEVVLPKDPEVL